MKLHAAHPAGWALFEARIHQDDRGWLMEALRLDVLRSHAGPVEIVQQNFSRSHRGVLRGLHYQLGAPQGKLVHVLEGRIHDVIVDLRRDSPTFRTSFAFDLSADLPRLLWVPPGFAHGVLALEDSLMSYGLTCAWDVRLDRAIRWNSPELSIAWPLDGIDPIVSARDRAAPTFGEAELFEPGALACPPAGDE